MSGRGRGDWIAACAGMTKKSGNDIRTDCLAAAFFVMTEARDRDCHVAPISSGLLAMTGG
jgi:hypothetical protein